VLYASEESEGSRLRHPFDTVTEGVGLNRLTANFRQAQIDDAFHCSDQEAVDMSRFLLQNEGLWVGSSSAVNCVGAVKAARRLGPGHKIVTILCDGGERHMSKFYNALFLEKQGLRLNQPSRDLSWIAVD
jgi:cysteine synthase A